MAGESRVVECECGQLLVVSVGIPCPSCGKYVRFIFDGAYIVNKNSSLGKPLLTRHKFNSFDMAYFPYKFPEINQHIMLEWDDHSVDLDIAWDMDNIYKNTKGRAPMCWKPTPLQPLTNKEKGV